MMTAWRSCPHRLPTFWVSAILFAAWMTTTLAPPPPPHRIIPGVPIGNTDTHWMAPYTLATQFSVEGKTVTEVRWFEEDGRVRRTLSGDRINARGEFISEFTGDQRIVHGVDGRWSLVVPQKPGPAGYITGTGDLFVHQFHPIEGQIAADVYVRGNHVRTVGPLAQYKTEGVQLADDGSWALLTWTSLTKSETQVVVHGTQGSVSYFKGCGENVRYPFPVGDGRGVLVKVEGLKEPPVRYKYSQGEGEWRTIAVGPNADPVVSPRGQSTVLFRTSIGQRERFQWIDCTTGIVRWEIPSPVEKIEHAATLAYDLDGTGMILFVGRDFAAVAARTGDRIARWEPTIPRIESGRIVRVGDRLFIVTPKQFAEINLADISAKRNGWR